VSATSEERKHLAIASDLSEKEMTRKLCKELRRNAGDPTPTNYQ
jgi:hypothetical protein